MQKRVHSLFGDEAVRFVKESDMEGEHKTLWESWEKDSAGNSKLRIELTSREGRLKEVKIREMIDGKPIMTKFDSSYKLWGGEASPNEDYARLAERHRRNLPEFLRSITRVHNISESPKDVFFPYFIKEGAYSGGRELKKPAPSVFTQVGKISQEDPGVLRVFFPSEVADIVGLNGGVQGAWTKEGKSLILTPLQGIHYPVRLFWSSGSLEVTIPRELMISMKLKPGMYVELLDEGKKLEMREAEGAPVDSVKIRDRKNSYQIGIPQRIRDRMHLKEDMGGEWLADGERLSLELMDNAPFITRIAQIWNPYTTNASSVIPQELAESLGLKKDMSVSFRINEKGQLVITPKQA